MHPGPVNRGVELSAEVIDSPQALIAQQVESGVVVRMAVLYELLASGDEARGDTDRVALAAGEDAGGEAVATAEERELAEPAGRPA
jgi:hypothetical protein